MTEKTPLDNVELMVLVFKEHMSAHEAATTEGNEAALRDIERKIAKVYMDTYPVLLKLAISAISVFAIFGCGLFAEAPPSEEDMKAQLEGVNLLISSINSLVPVGFELSGTAYKARKGDLE